MSCRTSGRASIVLFVMLAHTWFVVGSHRFFLCDNQPKVNVEECPYGYGTNYCGHFCKSGPRGPCDYINAACGAGLLCVCNQCMGCSMDTVECVNVTEENAIRHQCNQNKTNKWRLIPRAPEARMMLIGDFDDYYQKTVRD